MSENSLTLLFTFFPSVDDSHHSKFHEATRGEEHSVTVEIILHRTAWCQVCKAVVSPL